LKFPGEGYSRNYFAGHFKGKGLGGGRYPVFVKLNRKTTRRIATSEIGDRVILGITLGRKSKNYGCRKIVD
jgi:hypothetical protein